MTPPDPAPFLAGVIEGFYGPPWSPAERRELFGRMAAGGLNTYLYAPKDDLKQRARWREDYSETEAAALRLVIQACREAGLRFLYALSPGLDLRYADDADLARLHARLDQMRCLGVADFALLFDDIPDRLAPADAARFDSFAAAHARVTNAVFRRCRELAPQGRFLFCPTPYCGRMAAAGTGGPGYLSTVGRELLPGIDILWTGPEIVSATITAGHVREVAAQLRRKPVIWDNLHANDYDGRRFYCGPYAGRAPELRAEVGGLLLNPNTEFPFNFVPVRTLAAFVRSDGDWDPRAAYLSAVRAWQPHFATGRGPIAFEDLVALLDCFYLPYTEGPEAEALFDAARRLGAGGEPDPAEIAAFRARATRLRDTCARLAELEDRPLFYALSRRVWELREELELLLRWVEWRTAQPPATKPFRSDFHLPGTYRGGLAARLQDLLVPQADGTFLPAAPRSAQSPAGSTDPQP